MSVTYPEREWKVFNRWFVSQEGTSVTFKPFGTST